MSRYGQPADGQPEEPSEQPAEQQPPLKDPYGFPIPSDGPGAPEESASPVYEPGYGVPQPGASQPVTPSPAEAEAGPESPEPEVGGEPAASTESPPPWDWEPPPPILPPAPEPEPSGKRMKRLGGSAVKRHRFKIIGALVVLIPLLCCAGGALATFLASNFMKNIPGIQNLPTSVPSATRPSGQVTEDVGALRAVQPGGCIQNFGSSAAPEVAVVQCTTGTYEVLKNIPGRADPAACVGTAGYSTTYVVKDPESEALSFTLCLRRH